MSMNPATAIQGYVVELLFDPVLTQRLDALRRELHHLGISAELDSTPPHISIGAADKLQMASMQAALANVVSDLAPIPVTFTGVAHFPGDRMVVYLVPEPSNALLAHHSRLHEVLAVNGSGLDRYYLPEIFVPHATIATGVTTEGLQELQRVVEAKCGLPISGRIEGVGLFAIGPKTDNEVWRQALA